MRFMVVAGKVAAGQFCDFLRRRVYGAQRPAFLIVDGHPVHRSVKVKTLADSFKGTLKLFYLPPYSPELNPDEWVGNQLRKNNGIGRMTIVGPDDMKRKVISQLKVDAANAGPDPVLISGIHHQVRCIVSIHTCEMISNEVPESTVAAQIMWRSVHGIRVHHWCCRLDAT